MGASTARKLNSDELHLSILGVCLSLLCLCVCVTFGNTEQRSEPVLGVSLSPQLALAIIINHLDSYTTVAPPLRLHIFLSLTWHPSACCSDSTFFFAVGRTLDCSLSSWLHILVPRSIPRQRRAPQADGEARALNRKLNYPQYASPSAQKAVTPCVSHCSALHSTAAAVPPQPTLSHLYTICWLSVTSFRKSQWPCLQPSLTSRSRRPMPPTTTTSMLTRTHNNHHHLNIILRNNNSSSSNTSSTILPASRSVRRFSISPRPLPPTRPVPARLLRPALTRLSRAAVEVSVPPVLNRTTRPLRLPTTTSNSSSSSSRTRHSIQTITSTSSTTIPPLPQAPTVPLDTPAATIQSMPIRPH